MTLSKVELILNTLSSGYHVAWVDTDVVHFSNALPYLLTLDTDIALSNENCHVNSNFNPMHWNRSQQFNQNTGAGLRVCSSWPSNVPGACPCAASRPGCLWSRTWPVSPRRSLQLLSVAYVGRGVLLGRQTAGTAVCERLAQPAAGSPAGVGGRRAL